MSAISNQPLAPVGSTGNNNHNAVRLDPSASKIAIEFVVEAIGATPTITYKVQGCFNDTPSATDWQDLIMLPADSDTAAVSPTVTTVNRKLSYIGQAHTRFVRQVRLVTSANTNVTYSANLKQQIHP